MYRCKFCGLVSFFQPKDQEPPADYCHVSDHRPCSRDECLEMLIAADEHQAAWDAQLVFWWGDRRYEKMSALEADFRARGGHTKGLRRRQERLAYDMTVGIFIAKFLAPLNERLWDTHEFWVDDDLWLVVDALGRSSMDCAEVDHTRYDRQLAARRE